MTERKWTAGPEEYKPSIRDKVRRKINAASYRAAGFWRDLCWRAMWLGYEETNLERHARTELKLAEWDDDKVYGGKLLEANMRVVRLFCAEGHSGMSAGLSANALNKLLRYEPLTPLAGSDEEWADTAQMGDDSGLLQNKRCSHVFKKDGHAFDTDARVFFDDNGIGFTSYASRKRVEFPYTPQREELHEREISRCLAEMEDDGEALPEWAKEEADAYRAAKAEGRTDG